MGDNSGARQKTRAKSQAKPLFALLVCIIILSSAAFAEGYINSGNETSGSIIMQITRIIGLIFENRSITAMLVLENNTPIAGEELRFYENETALSFGITDESGAASIGYNSTNGEHNISVLFKGSENLAPSNLSGTIIINNSDTETATQQQTVIGEIIEIFFSKLSVLHGEIMTLGARLTYGNSTPIPGESLEFFRDSAYIGSNITDENGTAILSYNTSASPLGNITINVTHGAFWNVSAVEIFAPDNPASEANETNSTANISENASSEFNTTKTNSANITAPINITVEEFGATQGFAETGKPVAWTKRIRVKNNAGENAAQLINISIDGDATNIVVEGNIAKKEIKIKANGGLGIASIENKKDFEFGEMLAPLEEKEYLINYETPAPEKIEGENETSGAEWKKKVTIFSDYSYKNVSSYTDITESDKANIHLFWNVSGELVDVTNSEEINITYVDTNNNGKIDRIYWIVPHLSEQEFVVVVDLTVINLQSYPAVGGNWTVRFTTTGTANLTISAIGGTTWSNDAEDKDLKFLELKCGADSIASEWINDSVFIENYFCNETSYETSKVLTSGKHHLTFRFGDDADYANNMAGCSLTCDSASNNVCIISSPKEVLTDCYIDDSVLGGNTSIEIQSGGSIYNNTNNASFAINVTGNITIKSGGNITGNVNISAANLTIESGGLISASGMGYAGGVSGGNGKGRGGGAGENYNSRGGGGGAHGGNGGKGYGGLAGGTSYDNILSPGDFGSGGGAIATGAGGAGGGMILLNISGTLNISGSIISNGTIGAMAGSYGSGGGSGGAIIINTTSIAGNGTIYVAGGVGANAATYDGGGGGGGILTIYYTNKTFSGRFIAHGNIGYGSAQYGGAGTIYLKSQSQAYGDMTIDNNGSSGALTPLNSSAYTTIFDTLTIQNAANVSSAVSPLSLNATTITGNGTLYLGTNSTNIRTSNLSMSSGIMTSTSGQINITFTNSINASNFAGTVSTSSGAINLWYGSSSSNRCDVSGATITGATPTYYYAKWSNTTAYRCVRSIIIDSPGVMDATNTTRILLNTNEQLYPSIRIREYNGTDYFDIGGNWNVTVYNSNGSVTNTTHNTTNTSTSYFWKTQVSYSESTAAPYSFYSNTTGISAVGMSNYSNASMHTYSVNGISVTESLNATNQIANPADTILVSGKAVLQPDDTDITDTNASIYLDNVFQSNATTNTTGHYNYTFTAPMTAGNHTIKVNITNADGIYGSNETNLSVSINLSSPSSKGITTGIANANINENVNLSVLIPISNIDYPVKNISSVWVAVRITNASVFEPNTTGLVGWWQLNDNSTSDSSVNNNSGTRGGGVNCSTTGKFDGGCQFDGSGYITIADSPSLNIPSQITFEAWVNPTSISGQNRVIIWRDSLGSSDRYWQFYIVQTTGNVTLNLYDSEGTSHTVTSSATIPPDQWSHVAGTYNGSIMATYINGVQDANTNAAAFSLETGNEPLVLGADNDYNQYRWSGKMDEIRIYNRSLSAQDILDSYNNAKTRFLSGNSSGGLWSYAELNFTMLGEYDATFYANLTDGFNTTIAANATFNVKQLNITYAINDTSIYASEYSLINGTIYRETEHAISASTLVNITLNSGSSDAGGKTTDASGRYSFTYTPAVTSITAINFTLNATDSEGITGTTTNSSAITVYPAIAVDTWASTTSACSDRMSGFNITDSMFLCANITHGTSKTAGAYVNFSVSDIGSYAYGAANPVFTNTSIYDSGAIVWSPLNLSESTKYRITATAWNPIVNALITTQDTYDFNYGNLNISANLTDYVIMPDANITIIGKVYDYFNEVWARINTFVRIVLDGTELTNGGHYNKTWATNENFSNGTSINVTNSSNSLVLDPRGQYYFEAESFVAQSNVGVANDGDNDAWDGTPSGGQYITSNHPAWANYNITGIPNGTYYVFVKMRMNGATSMANITWDGTYINATQRSAGYIDDILWSDSLATPVIINATSHILGFNSTTNGPSIDVILLTTNSSYVPNDTDQTYVSVQTRYSGYFTSNKTTADYPIISITTNWTSNEPAGTNSTIDISADNGATWCANVTKLQEYRSGCGIGTGNELVWRANLSANNSFLPVRLENIAINYETGNATKTNSSGNYSFAFSGGSTLGWHTVKVNATDAEGINGNISTTYYIDNFSISTDTTPNIIDVDSLSDTINVTIASNAGRTSGRRYNITATIINPDSTQDTITNSSFSCTNNYPMTCNATWAPGIQPLGWYNVTINFEDNESITGTNTTNNDFNIDNTTTTITSSDSAPIIAKNITISGTARTNSSAVLKAANITITTSSAAHLCGYNTSMSGAQYSWSINCNIDSAGYSSELGPATVNVRINDTTGTIWGQNATPLTIWAPTIANYTNATSYAGTNTEHNITGFYWRTDVLGAIPGLINATVFNSTYSLSKTCSDASSCLKNFTIGPSGELAGGNYTVWINASNDSAYYMPNSTEYNIYLEEPKAVGTINVPNHGIYDMTMGIDYSFNETVSLNNTNGSTMYSPNIEEVIDYGTCTDIKSVSNLTPKYCSDTAPGAGCQVKYNITVSGSASVGNKNCLDWKSNWTNRDNTVSQATKNDYIIQISGNPRINVSQSSINVTDNTSSNITQIIVTNGGNVDLGMSSVPSDSIFVDFISGSMPSSWISFDSDAGAGIWYGAGSDYWDFLSVGPTGYNLYVNITANNYTAGTFNGSVNITSYLSGLLQSYAEINISITILPNISISQDLINHTQFIGAPNITNITIEANGNSPITNITATYIPESMPASWINISSIDSSWNASSSAFSRITEYTGKILNVNITALNYTSGTYTGKINLTTNENLNRLINVSVTISPEMSINQSLINLTQNISFANTALIIINSTGNAPVTNVTIALVNSTIPQSWISLSSTASEWDSYTRSFSRISEATNRTLNVTIKATNYTEGIYTGILNITTNENQKTQINITINITPAATAYNINKAEEHGTATEVYHIINSTGNAPLINATATYIESTLPASWVALNYSGQSGQSISAGNITEGTYKNITVQVTIPIFQTAGNYVGYINTTFDNEPAQQITVTLTVNTNSSWYLQPPADRNNTFVLGQNGVIGNITIVNTGNTPINYTITYNTSGVCDAYSCMDNGESAGYNNASAYIPKNSNKTIGIWQKGDSNTRENARIIANISNLSGTPSFYLAYMRWNITNSPPLLVNLTTLPNGYVELNKSLTLYAIISDDESLDIDPAKGLNLSSVYFNVTDPAGYTYHMDNNSIYWWDTNHFSPEADRKKFNRSFSNTTAAGIHNLAVYIKDKSNNEINVTIFQFEVIGATSINISASTPSAAANITSLHGENLTIPINMTNIGRATAYNITITGIFGNGTAWNRTYSQLNESQSIQSNITLEINAGTEPGSIPLTPKVIWTQPNTTLAENITAYNITITIDQNPELALPDTISADMNHSSKKNITFYANSTGNYKYVFAKSHIVPETTQLNWTCFTNNCPMGYPTKDNYGEFLVNDSKTIKVFAEVPAGTAPGNYTFAVVMNSTSYGPERGKRTNVTITVLADMAWSYSRPYNASTFELNTPGIAGIITLNGSGNTGTNFTISYNNWSDKDYHSYPGLFNESQNNSGVIVNPTSITLDPNELKNITIYHNGHYQGLTNLGINVTLSNSTAMPAIQSVLIIFNLTETAPNITNITFFNASYVELNKTIGIKVHARDDASLNLSTIRINITDPLGGATVTVTPENTSENLTAYGKYVRMNFTYLFANTSIAGNYTVNASISDEYSPTPYNTQSAQYTFQVIGATTMNLSANATSYALSGITQASGNNITFAINATNTGFVTAYNTTLSGNFSANASLWTVFNASLGNISALAISAANLTIYAPPATWPGTYYFTPSITWKQPNGSIAQYISSPVSIIVASNKTIVFTEYSLNFTISHGTTNSTTIRINSTGNDNVTNLMIYLTNTPSNFTVTLNQSTISTVPAGESRQIVLNITPNSGITNSTYSFDLNVNNDTTLLSTYHYTIIVPASYSWVKNKNSTVINAIAGQNAIDSSINITNNGNIPVSLTFSPVGDVVSANILVSAVEPSKTIQPLQTYAIQLNHTAKNENANYTGTLIIGNGSAFENVALDYYSYIAELNIINISPNYDVLSGDPLNITTQVLFGGNNITENLTYTIALNGTSCAISQNATNGGYVVHTCTAPSIGDGIHHNISMNADYLFTTGIVPMSASNASAVYYKDVTNPRILSHSITPEQEILENISINATLYDNILLDTAIAEIKFPNGTAYANLTLSNTTASNYSAIFTAPDAVGTYSARYYVNDTTGNLNSSVTGSFEIYEWANFSGLMQDMNSNPVDVSFNVTNSSGGQIALFQTNVSGEYNATIKRKTYNLDMVFLNSTVQLSDVDFALLPSDFIDIDRPLVGDYGFQGNVLKGFAVNTSLTSSGTLTIYYSAAEASTYLTNYFQIYRCVNWDYGLRNCNNGLSKLTSAHDKINRKLTASFTEMGTFLLVEDLPKDRPEMTIPTSLILGDAEHGKTNTSYLTVQSTGSLAITRIDFSCISGTVCTSFNVSAATILGFDAGATYDEPINITVPRYYAPGTYEGTFEAISNRGSVYEQVKDIAIRVNVLEDNNWTVQANSTLDSVGGGANGTFPSFEIKNNANLPVYFTISPNTTDIIADPAEILIAKNSSVQINLNYIAPQSVNYYNYSINVSGTGTDITKEIDAYATLNVTHAINMTGITPSENISVGQNMLINATASYLGTFQTSNISWTVFMDETPCDNITYSYNTTNWLILCKAPNMSAKLSYALKLKGTFGNYGGLVAYASAYDLANIYYVDTIPPQITNMTESGEESGSNRTINIIIADYSNITNFTISIFMPNGTSAGVFNPINVVNKTYSLTYNFSELGDYLLRCSMIDSLNNNGTEDKYFEVFRNMTFSGKVEKANTNGTWTSFKLYRPGQNFSQSQEIHEFSSGIDGKYNQTIHYRLYDIEIKVNGENNMQDTIKLYDVNLTEYNADPIDIDFVSANNAQIENANELRGIAVKTNITASGRITLYYSPSASTYEDNINVYKCADWNFTRSRCDGTWAKINGSASDLDTSNDKISADITGFSAYIAAEATQPIIVELSGTPPITVSGGGGGGGGGGDYTSAISDIKQKITTLIEGTSEFSVDTKSISKQLYPGERVNIAVGVKNALNESIRMTVKANGEFANFTTFGNAYLDLGAQESGTFNLELFIPKSAYPGNYEGKVLINNGKVDTIVPVSLRILDSKNLPITVDVQPLVDNIAPGSVAKVKVGIINTGANELPIDYVVSIIDPVTGALITEIKGSLIATSSESIYLNFSIPENITLESSQSQGFENVKTKRYMVRATVKSSDPALNVKAESVSFISVTERLNVMKISILGIPIWVFITVILLSTTGYIGRKRYIAWVSSKKKYAETLDFKSLPQASTRSAFIGKIAETDIRTFLDLDTLQMHTIVAGSTGGGKTVAAQIIVEEALLKGAAVVVFDPTAQWSGFLRPNRDKKMLKTYGKFDMKVGESRAFNGNIREITDAHQIVDVTKYMNPGEITIFTMNHMDTKDIDFFVANTVKEVFHAGLEGAQKLKLLMVYDEVHRLLAKYGGTGDGFIQLERGVREFRKWGIGLVLISQVLSDFIGTIKANIGTEIQVRSRDESDLERIKMKYGEDMMRSIVKAAVGEGLLQNAQYNKGRPYFVSFRPLLHATERVSDEELKKYNKYNGKIDDLKYQIECLKAEAVDVFDIELELKLTAENLMKGKFNMVDIYLEELEPKVASLWKKLGKEPKKRTVAYASDEDIKKEVERAKREREDYIKKQKMEEDKAKAAAGPAPAKKEGAEEKEEKEAEKTEPSKPEEKTEESPKAAAKPQEWTTEKEHKKSRKVYETHDKDYHESIKQEVIKDIRKRAKEEDARVAAAEEAVEKKQGKMPENGIKDMEQELNALYQTLKEKIAESKKNGKDVSVVSLKSITIPSDIKLAAVDENPAELKKIKGKIEALINKL